MDFVDDAAAAAAAEDMGEWEWPAHCEELREMENLLRCQICGDFFHGPVLLPCSHAFCSECVRKYLQTKGAHGCCPECKQACAPRDLVANRSMEKVALLFKKMKPKLLLALEKKEGGQSQAGGTAETKSSGASQSSSTRTTRSQNTKEVAANGSGVTSVKTNGKARAVERMPVVSYNVMKDKEIRKLLETINIRLPLKNRDEIIQIHKEYVLLHNAQIDSCNPKSAVKLRDEVIRNHKLRQQEKHQAEIAKKHTNPSPTANLTAQMKANFERLKQEIAERKANPQRAAAAAAAAAAASSSQTDDITVPPEAVMSSSLGLSSAPVGIWRHVYSHNHKKEFYINSVTREIRLERPPEFVQQQNPKNRYDDDFEDDDGFATIDSTDAANHSVDLTDDAVSEPPSRRQSRQPQQSISPTSEVEIFEPPRSAVKAPTLSHLRGKEKRPAGFFSPDVSAATQDFSLSSDEGEDVTQSITSTAELSASAVVTTTTTITSTTDGGDFVGEDTKWDCPRCTLVNETSSSLCEACGYESKQQQQPARKRQKKMQFQSKISLG